MIGSLSSARGIFSSSIIPNPLTFLQSRVCKVFSQIQKTIPQNVNPILESWNFIEGGIWAGFWGLSSLFSGLSFYELYNVLTMEHPADKKFAKIGSAVKTALVDFISLGGATAYNVHWAHQVKILSLGLYAPLIKGLGCGASLIVNMVECGWSMYHVYTEKEGVLKCASAAEKERHRQRLCLSLIKVVGYISMIAWAALGIAIVASGSAVSPILMTTLLMVSGLFTFTAYFYQRHIEKVPLPGP
jgi:hypothetical protein